ncbi:hypothetical protein BDZ94DRAFT_259177 [Collybia nuda]|uniref:Uncharacterized protein n=1 Tax=Collybia nuda TaxID=64659 RepID=A0A9P6CDN4_9AGAR|nr:hypothetical protein BDZ94DRAFT_259177 [Collybia nuda]
MNHPFSADSTFFFFGMPVPIPHFLGSFIPPDPPPSPSQNDPSMLTLTHLFSLAYKSRHRSPCTLHLVFVVYTNPYWRDTCLFPLPTVSFPEFEFEFERKPVCNRLRCQRRTVGSRCTRYADKEVDLGGSPRCSLYLTSTQVPNPPDAHPVARIKSYPISCPI